MDGDWTDWEHDFLEGMTDHVGRDALTTRQREKLIELRDSAEHISITAGGFSITTLIEGCWLARLELDDEDDIAFIESLKGERSVKRRHVGRLMRCARKFAVVEDNSTSN